jgi:SAM-dependent methyltransferase
MAQGQRGHSSSERRRVKTHAMMELMVKEHSQDRLAVMLEMVACPVCGKKLRHAADRLRCLRCRKSYRIADKLYFNEGASRIDKWSKASMPLMATKGKTREICMPFGLPNDLEGFARPSMEHLCGPRLSQVRDHLSLSRNARMLYLGSGGDAYEGFIHLDYFPYKNVDVVADMHKLPFRTATMDCVATNSVFEHLKDPAAAFREACRVLKKGGYFYFCVPFLSPRHHQVDYWRWSLQGIGYMAQQSKMRVIDYGATRGFAYSLAPYIDAVSKLKLKKNLSSYIKRNAKQMIAFFSELDTVLDHKHPLRTAFASTLYVLMRS